MKADRAICKGCEAEILWVRNEQGKAEPFDWKSTRVLAPIPGETFGWEILSGVHLNHFLTCPKANEFRRSK